MPPVAAETFTIWPLLFYGALVIVTAAGTIAAAYFLGERHRYRPAAMDQPYESGIMPSGSARLRLKKNGTQYWTPVGFQGNMGCTPSKARMDLFVQPAVGLTANSPTIR